MSKFRVELTDNYTEWYELASLQSSFTIFSDPDFLFNFADDKIFGFVLKGNEKKAFFSITLRDGKCKRPGLVIHNGVILNDALLNLKRVRRTLDEFYINETFVEFLDKEFNSIDLALHPYIRDIRPYLWLNYHSSREEDKCRIFVRYTSYLDISELQRKDEFNNSVFDGLLEIRKRNIREAREKNVKTKVKCVPHLFSEFYVEMMGKQGLKVKSTELMEKIIKSLVEKDKARMFVTYYKDTPIYITVWGWDRHRAYYLYGAGNQWVDLRFKGTICFWDAILWLARVKRVSVIDWEGVNSPKRGFFKLSFGGSLLNYYWIKKGEN